MNHMPVLPDMNGAFQKPRLRSLLEHFATVEDPREAAKVRFPLPEVLLLVVSASVCSCDDYDEIVEWGEATWTSCAATPSSTSAFPEPTGCAC